MPFRRENARWYSDQALTQVAAFPQGEPGETYTIYCRFTTGLYVSDISNGAEDESYSAVYGPIQPNLSVSWGATNSRSDQYRATAATFEKLVDGAWVEVDERYYTDYMHNTWANMIWFSSVADSGTYRLKHLRYTATDINGNVLFYDTTYDPAGADKTYTVKINPVELTIDGVQAVGRPADGTTSVALTGGHAERRAVRGRRVVCARHRRRGRRERGRGQAGDDGHPAHGQRRGQLHARAADGPDRDADRRQHARSAASGRPTRRATGTSATCAAHRSTWRRTALRG